MIDRLALPLKRIAPLTCFVLLCFAVGANASVPYIVKRGDTLSGIAKKFGVSVRAISGANAIDARRMRPGAKIVIPLHEAPKKKIKKSDQHGETAKEGKTSTGDENAKRETNQPEEELFHTVKRGETLHSIARHYSVSVAELKELNGLRSSKIKKGRKLLVERTGPKTYVVKKGDTIEKIAKKFDMDADRLMELNEMESSEIKPGRKLYIECTVVTPRAERLREKVEKIEQDLKETASSEEFEKEDEKEKLITFAKKLLDIPYKFGGNSIFGIDCSAYVKKVYGLLGIDLPRTAREQFREGGEALDRDHLSIGDLVFFRTYASFPSHVGIYLGDNLFIHASSKGRKVTIDSLETPYYLKRFIGGKRFLTENGRDTDQKG
jgi:peptidoglycan endopeptidase LytE